jgi:hypothetical protein
MHPDGRLFVARFDFTDCSKHGLITVLNQDGQIEEELEVKDCPEITGLFFSKQQDDILYATESTTNSFLKIQVTSTQS